MKKVWMWIKKNPLEVTAGITLTVLSIAESYFMLKSNERVGGLEKENRNLESENIDLKGQIRAIEKENRRLSHEVNNMCYQLGKKEASKQK